ncbi:MAG: DUF1223 domain-containing protein [Alphaproteobacteria bacterium]|nr:DUF1223 domain-containing protein [Alphaproteobacteria bacterium]
MIRQTILLSAIAAAFWAAPAAANVDFPPAVPAPIVEGESLSPPEPAQQPAEPEQAIEKTQDKQPETEPQNIPVEISSSEEPGKIEEPVESLALPPLPQGENGPVVVELFSSQACVFCPKADAFLGELAQQPALIALDCHVSYFDVKVGALSLPFCSSRQSLYEGTLRAGPKYTPQMVINGRYDAIGYRKEAVLRALEKASQDRLQRLKIEKEPSSGLFDLSFPALEGEEPAKELKIWLLVFDLPHNIKVAEGGNSGKNIIYTNIVSNAGFLGTWDGNQKSLRFDAKLQDNSAGFAVLAQDETTGKIYATGQYKVP